jgi:hypothetical protein
MLNVSAGMVGQYEFQYNTGSTVIRRISRGCDIIANKYGGDAVTHIFVGQDARNWLCDMVGGHGSTRTVVRCIDVHPRRDKGCKAIFPYANPFLPGLGEKGNAP